MFGFPEKVSDWTSRDYLRLFTMVMVYITVRPLIQGLYKKLGERQRLREKKKLDEEKAREYKQQRVKEKLGISESEDAEGKSTQLESADIKRKVTVEDMPSDEDVSDLLH